VLQDEAQRLYGEVTPASVRALLAGRSAREATDEDLQRARALSASPAAHSELWLVGGPRLLRLRAAAEASHLEVTDVLEPGARCIAIALRARGKPPARVLLDLPPPAACARLLRDPFSAARAPPARLPGRPGAPQLLFSASGRRLIFPLHDGLAAAPVPGSRREPPGRVSLLRLRGESRALGAAARRGRIHAVAAAGEELTLYRPGGPPRELAFAFPGAGALADGALRPLCVLRWPEHESHLFLDAAGALSELTPDRGVQRLLSSVIAFAPGSTGALAVVEDRDGYSVRGLSTAGIASLLTLRGEPGGRACFGFDGYAGPRFAGLAVAVQTAAERWIICGRGTLQSIAVPAHLEVIGPMGNLARSHPPYLIALDRAKGTLHSIHGDGFYLGEGVYDLLPVPGAVAACLSPAAPHVAVLDAHGAISVHSLTELDAPLLRLVPDEVGARR
jgi:hypothetical protein